LASIRAEQSSLHDLGFRSNLADPDVWYKQATKPDGFQYYEYVLVHVDDILVISHHPITTMTALGILNHLKEGSVEVPECYLGVAVQQWCSPEDAGIADAGKD